MRYLTIGETLQLHAAILRQAKTLGVLRDVNALESAIAQPRLTFDGADLYLNLRKNMERDKKKTCHPERSEGSLPQLSLRLSQGEMLRSAQKLVLSLSKGAYRRMTHFSLLRKSRYIFLLLSDFALKAPIFAHFYILG